MLLVLEQIDIHRTVLSFHGIFVRCAGMYADEYVLDRLGIEGFSRSDLNGGSGSYLIVAEDTDWIHILDDFLFTLWHTRAVHESIPVLGQEHEVFTFSVGDADDSFDFAYYRGGRLIRKFVVVDDDYRGGVVTEDVGTPLPVEAEAMSEDENLSKVHKIAQSLGIDLRHRLEGVRVYIRG